MNAKRREMWATYFKHISDKMELRGWRYTITRSCCEPHAGASFGGIQGKDEAQISLSRDWEDFPACKQRQYAVHELVHSYLHEADTFVLRTFESLTSASENARLYNTFDLITEHAVERIAWALTPNMPFPADVIPALGKKSKGVK